MVEITCDFSKEKASEHEDRYCPYNTSGRCTKDTIEVTIEIGEEYPGGPVAVGREPLCMTGAMAQEELAGQAVIRMPILQRLRRFRK